MRSPISIDSFANLGLHVLIFIPTFGPLTLSFNPLFERILMEAQWQPLLINAIAYGFTVLMTRLSDPKYFKLPTIINIIPSVLDFFVSLQLQVPASSAACTRLHCLRR
jgi:hypothetical protein